MSRPNKPREVYAEDHLADRIISERKNRGWTIEGLAKRMTNVGCAIDQSAIYKIEQGKPRRRITFNEAASFARVFDLTLADLATDPELWQAKRLAPLLDMWQRNNAQYMELIRAHDRRDRELRAEIREAAAGSPVSRKVIEQYLTDWMGPARSEETNWPARFTDQLLEED